MRAAVDRNKFRPQMRTPDPQRLRSSFVEGPSISALGGQAESVAALSSDDPVVIRARKPVALGEPVLKQLLTEPGSYGRLLNLCARNVVKGPPTEKCHEDAVYSNHTNVVGVGPRPASHAHSFASNIGYCGTSAGKHL